MFSKACRSANIRIAPATVLAPMAGVTDTVFRRLIRGLGGCGLIMTEFTSAEGVTRNAVADASLSVFRARRAPHHRAIVRRQPQGHGGRRGDRRRPGLRHRRHQFGLPGQKSGEVRRLRPAPRSWRPANPSKRRAGRRPHSADHQDSRRLGRQEYCGRGRGAHGRIDWRRGHRRSSADAHAGIRGRGGLEHHPRRQAGRAHSRDWQRRYSRRPRMPSAWCGRPAATP